MTNISVPIKKTTARDVADRIDLGPKETAGQRGRHVSSLRSPNSCLGHASEPESRKVGTKGERGSVG